jgi:phosphopantothenoylcysteine decarboxylase/phosphopantothenate--cysteine ligase
VSDFHVADPADRKIKKEEGAVEVRLEAGPDLLASTREARSSRGIMTLGFALETDDAIENARRKLAAKGLDLIALNEAGRPDRGVEAETNQVTLIDADGVVEEIPLMAKTAVAERLLDHLERRIS